MLLALLSLVFYDLFLLFANNEQITLKRILGDKLSNGDQNPVKFEVFNGSKIDFNCKLIDEIPYQFQMRENYIDFPLKSGERLNLEYQLRPTERGEYQFGNSNLFITSKLSLISRKIIFEHPKKTAVYPSFLQMKKYEFLAISNRLSEYGIKKVRKVGHTFEFDHIREYTIGDDYRSINWRATAKKQELMVNQFQDERSQNIINVIDKGRNMKMPFNEMTLLDYAINSSLILSNIAIGKSDKAGLITFSQKIDSVLQPTKKRSQISKIQETLYNQRTGFRESNFEALFLTLRKQIKQRSLIILYTNFETVTNMKRNIHHLLALSKYHLLVVIIFENTEISEILEAETESKFDIYRKVTAEKYALQKNEICDILNNSGIQTIFTKPSELTTNTINKYLEIKAKRIL